jgi:riboflavin kinase/FMN adenylyltransferase
MNSGSKSDYNQWHEPRGKPRTTVPQKAAGNLPGEIKKALAAGDLDTAKELSGKDYCICGIVVHGNHLGRKLGFPTANLEPGKASPFIISHGVYFVKVLLSEEVFFGICNVGLRPTIGGTQVVTEVNIFDFDEDIYGQSLCMVFLARLRKEKKFRNLDALVRQIKTDKKKAVSLLSVFT